MQFLQQYKNKYKSRTSERMSMREYLELCKSDKMAYATAAERLLKACGEPKIIDTSTLDDRTSRIHVNRTIRHYDVFNKFYGMEATIEQVVGFFQKAADGLEEKKQILYLLGPVGSAKSSLAERIKQLMEMYPIYVLEYEGVLSPVFESPLGLFNPTEHAEIMEKEFGIVPRYLNGIHSPWAVKRLQEADGNIEKFTVVKIYPDKLQQIAITKTEPGDENNQDISTLVGKVNIRKIGEFNQNDTDCYNYSGGLCRSNQGLLEFVEMFKAPIKVLNPLLTATQEGNYNGTEAISSIPFSGVILAHSNESEWQSFKNNKNNEAFLDRVCLINVPYVLRKTEEAMIYQKMLNESELAGAPLAPKTLEIMAEFSVSSRLTKPEHSTVFSKMRVYDGESIKDSDPSAKSLRDYRDNSSADEGRTGISTRWAFKRISEVYNCDPKEKGACPVHLLNVLRNAVKAEEWDISTTESRLSILDEIEKRYYIDLEKDIKKAYLESYDSFGQNLFDNYIDRADHWCDDKDYKDPTTGQLYDRELLNRELEKIEKPAMIGSPKEFRQEMRVWALRYRGTHQGKNPDWQMHNKLRDVIEKNLFAKIDDLLPVISFGGQQTEENKKKHSNFLSNMMKKGYSEYQTQLSVEWYKINHNR